MIVFLVVCCGFEMRAVAMKGGCFGGGGNVNGRGEDDLMEVVEAIMDGV